MSQLEDRELSILRSQNGISKVGRGGRRYKPYAFTEYGAVIAATVLNSPIAVYPIVMSQSFKHKHYLAITCANFDFEAQPLITFASS